MFRIDPSYIAVYLPWREDVRTTADASHPIFYPFRSPLSEAGRVG